MNIQHVPKVSVIVPVYNAADVLERALSSVFGQTLPARDVEIVAVDDGSTDGSGELLDRLAAEHPRLTAVHQANSGGPGGPRNTGIERARGQYLFFLDADDYLGPEALARMVTMADDNGTDVVIGKYVGINRGVPRRIFKTDVPRVAALGGDPDPYGTLACLKLFRRELVMRHSIRFPEALLSGEDQRFTAHAYMHADGVSIVGGYDCYYWVARDDGSSAVQSGGADPRSYFASMTALLEMVDRHVEPGPVRDAMLGRHFALDLLGWRFNWRYLERTAEERRFTFAAARELVRRWMNPRILAGLDQRNRVIVHCLEHDHPDLLEKFLKFNADKRTAELVVEGDRVFAAKPGFRDPAYAVPDEVYEVTGEIHARRGLTGLEWAGGRMRIAGYAYLPGLEADREQPVLVLKGRRANPGQYRIPVERRPYRGGPDDGFDYSAAGFEALLELPAVADGAPLSKGYWDAFIEVRTGEYVQLARLGGAVDPLPRRLAPVRGKGEPFVAAGFTEYGNLTLEAGQKSADAGPVLRLESAGWADGGRWEIRGTVPAEFPEPVPGGPELTVSAQLRLRGAKAVAHGRTTVTHGTHELTVRAEFDAARLRTGRWDLWVEFAFSPPGHPEEQAKGRDRVYVPQSCSFDGQDRRHCDRRVVPYRTLDGGLSVNVTESALGRRARRTARRLLALARGR